MDLWDIFYGNGITNDTYNKEGITVMPWSKELQESYRLQSNIKDDLKDCPICESPVSQKDLDNYKMCHWCYSQ